MINLLPPQQKEELLNQEALKIIIILGILLLSFLLSLTLVLLAIKNYIAWDLEVEKAFLAEKERTLSFYQDLKEEIRGANLSFSSLNSFHKERNELAQVLETVSKTLPQGVYLTKFGFSPTKKGQESTVQISLFGFCPNREILQKLKKNLEDEESFIEIYFPPENWVKQTNVEFEVYFGLKEI